MPRGRPRGSGGGAIKPRGRMSSYAFFVQICREEHKKSHPDENVQFADFSRQCADRWKTMSDKEKKRFHDLATNDKERYDNEMQDYVPPPGATGRRARRARGSKKLKDPNKPKRALSAFFYYANEERPRVRALNPDFSVGEVAKELGRQWNELTETEKSPFERQAEEDRARYDRDMQIYKSGDAAPPPKKMKSNGHAAPPPPMHDDDDDDDLDDDEDLDDDDE